MPKQVLKSVRRHVTSSDDSPVREDDRRSVFSTPGRTIPPPPFLPSSFIKKSKRAGSSSSSSTQGLPDSSNRPPSPPSFLWKYKQKQDHNMKEECLGVKSINMSGGESDPVQTYMRYQGDALALVKDLTKKYEQEVKTNAILTKRSNKKSSKVDDLKYELDWVLSEQEKEKSEWKKKELDWKKKESEWKKKESEWNRKESEWLKRETEWEERESDWVKRESKWKKKEELGWKEDDSRWKSKADTDWKQKVESEIEKKLQFEWKMMEADRNKLKKLEEKEKKLTSQIEDAMTLISIQSVQLQGYKRLIRSVVPCLKQLKSKVRVESQTCELCASMIEIFGKIDDVTLAHADNALRNSDTPAHADNTLRSSDTSQADAQTFKKPEKKLKKTPIWPRSSANKVPDVVVNTSINTSTSEKSPTKLEFNLVPPGTSLHLLSQLYSSPKSSNSRKSSCSLDEIELPTTPMKRKSDQTDEDSVQKKTLCDVTSSEN